MADSVPLQGGDAGDARKGAFRDKKHEQVAWSATALTLSGYFIVMLLVPLAPGLLAQPLLGDGLGSVGFVVGIGVLILQIGVSIWYTKWINKLDKLP